MKNSTHVCAVRQQQCVWFVYQSLSRPRPKIGTLSLAVVPLFQFDLYKHPSPKKIFSNEILMYCFVTIATCVEAQRMSTGFPGKSSVKLS